jgi:hypothetical protein
VWVTFISLAPFTSSIHAFPYEPKTQLPGQKKTETLKFDIKKNIIFGGSFHIAAFRHSALFKI